MRRLVEEEGRRGGAMDLTKKRMGRYGRKERERKDVYM